MNKPDKKTSNKILQVDFDDEGNPIFGTDGMREKLIQIFGLPSGISNQGLSEYIDSHLGPLLDSQTQSSELDEEEAKKKAYSRINVVLAQIQEMQPTDQTEVMLCLQLIGLNNAFLKTNSRISKNSVSLDRYERYVNLMQKLASTVNKTVSAINKQRNKGQQNVTVKHVHVHKGGQAAIGSFKNKGEGE